jgi:hypothetical protein
LLISYQLFQYSLSKQACNNTDNTTLSLAHHLPDEILAEQVETGSIHSFRLAGNLLRNTGGNVLSQENKSDPALIAERTQDQIAAGDGFTGFAGHPQKTDDPFPNLVGKDGCKLPFVGPAPNPPLESPLELISFDRCRDTGPIEARISTPPGEFTAIVDQDFPVGGKNIANHLILAAYGPAAKAGALGLMSR